MKDFGQEGQKCIFCLETEIAPISPIIFATDTGFYLRNLIVKYLFFEQNAK